MLKGQGRFSRPIVSIAILGIILGVAIMLITLAIVRGFRSEVRDKVVAFNSHIQVKELGSLSNAEGKRIRIDSQMMEIGEVPGVDHVQLLAQRAAILETDEGIDGVMAKGVGPGFNWSFFKENTVEGTILNRPDSAASNEVFLSRSMADKLDIEVGDRVSVYFIKDREDISTRRLTVCGLFKSDLEEFDMQFIFMDMRHLQKVNNWGLQAQIQIGDTCNGSGVGLTGLAFGGEGKHYFEWENAMKGPGPHFICPQGEENLWMAVHDDVETIPDTAYVTLFGPPESCACDSIEWILTTAGGSQKYYTGGYEVFIEEFDDLKSVNKEVWNKVTPFLATTDIVEQTPEIFSWLELFDVNVYIIITLMIGVAIINMSSALLIMILERSNMIGILKSLGSDDWSIRQIFMRQAAFLIIKGLLWGNLIGIGLALIQLQFGVVDLPAESYYLNTVPIQLDWRDILFIDLGTLIICTLALLLPSWLITRISPVRAIRFD